MSSLLMAEIMDPELTTEATSWPVGPECEWECECECECEDEEPDDDVDWESLVFWSFKAWN